MERHQVELILASSSPRRQELLRDGGYRFTVSPPADTAEVKPATPMAPADLVVLLATQKARDVAQRTPRGLIVAADTVAECDGEILGKPRDRAHAREILLKLGGTEHQVLTGVCLWQRPGDRQRTRAVSTRLFMKPWTETQLEAYLDSGRWQGKAGAFGYQDGLDWVEIRAGSATNVVGLPMETLAAMLADIGRE